MYHNPRYKYVFFTLLYKSNLQDESVISVFKKMSAILQDSPHGKLKKTTKHFPNKQMLVRDKTQGFLYGKRQKQCQPNILEIFKGYLWNLQPCCSLHILQEKCSPFFER